MYPYIGIGIVIAFGLSLAFIVRPRPFYCPACGEEYDPCGIHFVIHLLRGE